jgi:hypothetical protein
MGQPRDIDTDTVVVPANRGRKHESCCQLCSHWRSWRTCVARQVAAVSHQLLQGAEDLLPHPQQARPGAQHMLEEQDPPPRAHHPLQLPECGLHVRNRAQHLQASKAG